MKEDSLTLSESVATRLRQEILDGGGAEGALLMTEKAVSERFGVSRTIAREAVSRLRALGIVESRQRQGLSVGRSDPMALWATAMPFFGRTSDNVRDLAQLRYVLEMGAIDLAIANATGEQIDEFVRLAEEYESAATRARRKGRDEDRIEEAFHGHILRMTNNELIIGMHRVVQDYFRQAPDHVPGWNRESAKDVQATIRQHHVIAAAFRDRDAELAKSQLKSHLRLHIQSWREPAEGAEPI